MKDLEGTNKEPANVHANPKLVICNQNLREADM
jgi:hypothetical protein